jgi:hypothetical protein
MKRRPASSALRVGLEQRHLAVKKVVVPEVVGVEKREVATGRGPDAGVACRAGATVWLNEIAEAVSIGLERRLELCSIRRAVVDDDDLETGKRLRKNRRQRVGNIRARLVGRNDHRDGWLP